MNIIFIIILMLLIIVTFFAINSYRTKQIKQKSFHFEKSRIEYIEPPRPHSNSFNDLLLLTSSIYSRQHNRLTFILSQSVKNYMEFKGIRKNLVCSENLKLLIDDPNEWFHHKSDLITPQKLFHKKELTDIFYEYYIEILYEVQELLDISLVLKEE